MINKLDTLICASAYEQCRATAVQCCSRSSMPMWLMLWCLQVACKVRPLPWPVTFSFNTLWTVVVTHTHVKDQGHSQVVRKKKWKSLDGQTNGWTDGRRWYLPC